MESYKEKNIIESTLKHLESESVAIAMRINTTVRASMSKKLRWMGFMEIPPVIYSMVTDPLNHPVYDPRFMYDGTEYALTKSMIFHKQILVTKFPKIYTFSPNVRLEIPDKKKTGRHLLEFTQLDVEVRDASREDVMTIAESIIREAVNDVKDINYEDLEKLERKISIPAGQFKRFKYMELKDKYGQDFEAEASSKEKYPFWIIDIPLKEREFYDREKEDEPGVLRDMDLIYPEGFGEGISGGEREYQLERILERIKAKDQDPEQFHIFTEIASHGLFPSAGFGIGIERFIRYICGYSRIEYTHPFPKIPGEISL